MSKEKPKKEPVKRGIAKWLDKKLPAPLGPKSIVRAKRGHFGRVLYEVRRNLGLTQGNIGKLADVAVSMISRYEKGIHEPEFGTAALLTTAVALIDQAAGDRLEAAISEEMGTNLARRIIQRSMGDVKATIGTLTGGGEQPLSSNVGAGLIACTTRVSGNPDTKIEWEEEIPDDPVEFREDVRAARVVGDSMEPVARDGQRVLYSLEAKIRHGDLVIVKPPNSYRRLFKRFHKAPEGHALFESLNHNREPLFYKMEELEGRMWKVIGVIF